MNKPLLLKIHRWITLVFAIPLFAIILTGLILAFEPLVQLDGINALALDETRVVDLIKQYDPEGKARGVAISAAARRLTLQGLNVPPIDLVTGEPVTATSGMADLFVWARRTHERLLDQSWLVTGSTAAMIVIMSLGILMGLPRLRNSLAGWHKGAAWLTLPLIFLSPLTGLCLALGLTFQGGPPAASAGRISLADAVHVVSQTRDLSHVISIGSRGGRLMLRTFENGELRAYAVGAEGIVALPRNWPRLIHEGNWSAKIAAPLDILTSVVLLGLLATGLLLWSSRKWRRAPARQPQTGRRSVGAVASDS